MARSKDDLFAESQRLLEQAQHVVEEAERIISATQPAVARSKASREHRHDVDAVSARRTADIMRRLEAASQELRMLQARIEQAKTEALRAQHLHRGSSR